MRPAQVVSAVLLALAAGLAALLVFGPTEGAEATPEAAVAPATSEATTTEPGTALPATSEPETTTEEVEPPTTTEPAEPPPLLEGDGTFPDPVRIALYFPNEVDWRRAALRARTRRVRIEARATALRGTAGDVHGLECGSRRAVYSLFVDPWDGTYRIEWFEAEGRTILELDSGTAAGLESPPGSNVIRATCTTSPRGTRIVLVANGREIARVLDEDPAGSFGQVGLTAHSPDGAQEIIFDGVFVESG